MTDPGLDEAVKIVRSPKYLQTLLQVGDRVVVLSHGFDKYGGRFDGTVGYGPTLEDDLARVMLAAGKAVVYP